MDGLAVPYCPLLRSALPLQTFINDIAVFGFFLLLGRSARHFLKAEAEHAVNRNPAIAAFLA